MTRDPFSRMTDDAVISRGGPVLVPDISRPVPPDEQVEELLVIALKREDVDLVELCEEVLKQIIQPNLKRQAQARLDGDDTVIVNGATRLRVEYDIGAGRREGGAQFFHVSGPELDEDTLDELAADMARLSASSFGPVMPRFYRKQEAA